jgi:hypothetical protein
MEGARMVSACSAVRELMLSLGVGIDGGKDSLTMSAQVTFTFVWLINFFKLTCNTLFFQTDLQHTIVRYKCDTRTTLGW